MGNQALQQMNDNESFGMVDSDDPTHEKYTQKQDNDRLASVTNNKELYSPPRVTRSP
jgi:hypothetical protein